MTVVLADFNFKFKNWCQADITSLESSMTDTIACGEKTSKKPDPLFYF